MSDEHPLNVEEVEAVWRRFVAAAVCGPREKERLGQVESDTRGATIFAYLVGHRAGDFAFASVHEAEAFGCGRIYEPRPARRATLAAPGSDEKTHTLRDRAANGESLWHPGDHTPSPLERLLATA